MAKTVMERLSDLRAAQYVRMSTDHQQYSIENQIDAIREFADAKGLQLIRTYADPGISGLTLRHRPGLQRLLDDVAQNRAPFGKLLVYDVSRWGRFQDPDEAAAYEHHCRSRGVDVIYCQEAFDSSGGPVHAMLKHMRRTMAAEYSRDLSLRVIRAKRKIGPMGFWMGGPAPFGYQRWAVSPTGRRMKLEPGDFKHVQHWRTVLEPGPPEHVAAVKRIFDLFTRLSRTITEVTETMQAERWPAPKGETWHPSTVRHILRNEVYVGDLAINQTTARLAAPRVKHPKSDWIRATDAHPAIIERRTFAKASARFGLRRVWSREMADAEILARVCALLDQHGCLSVPIVALDPELPSADYLRSRFGSLGALFELAGYRVGEFSRKLDHSRRMRAARVDLAGQLRLALTGAGVANERDTKTVFRVDDQRIAAVITSKRCLSRTTVRWETHMPKGPIHLAVVGRCDHGDILDYRVLKVPRPYCAHLSIGPGSRVDRDWPVVPTAEDAANELVSLLSTPA